MGYPNDNHQGESTTTISEDGPVKRQRTGREIVILICAGLGALCLLPLVSTLLAGLVKLFFGLLAGALGLIAGLVSLVIGLALGAVGLVIGLLAAVAAILVSPPGLIVIAIVLYLKFRD